MTAFEKNTPVGMQDLLIRRAWEDEQFAERLRSDPRTAIAELGVIIPSDVELCVHEESDSVLHLVIPQKPAGDSQPLDVVGNTPTLQFWEQNCGTGIGNFCRQ